MHLVFLPSYVVQHVRMLKILLSFYIKISDFQRAEELVENNTFSESGKE